MTRFLTATLACLIPICGSCGGGGTEAAPADGPDLSIEDEQDVEHFLSVTVDGVRHEARGTLFGPSMVFGGREINVQVGGPLVTAVATGKSVSLGDYDILMNLLTNSVEPGDYSIVTNRNRVARSDDPLGFAEIFFPDSLPFGKLVPLSGMVTVDATDGSEETGRYRLQVAKGHGSGQFRDSAGKEHSVEFEFIYRR